MHFLQKFHLTVSRRGWRRTVSTVSSCHLISIHSLTKRLTNLLMRIHISLLHFNSQPHEEADLLRMNTLDLKAYFNSQPHEEADSNSAQKFLVQNCFFATITYIAFSVHLSFNFLRIFSSWIYPFAGANAPEKVVCLTFALIISRYL